MSLVDITKQPTAENSAIQLHPTDNVAVARVPLQAGQDLRVDGHALRVREQIAAGHKVALKTILGGDPVRRYGQVIGRAKVTIEAGQHIHTHNLAYEEGQRDYAFPEKEVPYPVTPANAPTFMGYQREDGRVGTRNYLAVVAASNCAAHTAELIAESFAGEQLPPNIDGVMSFPHGEGCGHAIGPDTLQLQRTLWGVLDHPNVAGAVVLGLGCEVNQIDHYVGGKAPRQSDRIVGMTLQATGGTKATVEASRVALRKMMDRFAAEKRVAVPAGKLVVGLNCGGSDSFSGITANPALGICSDRLAEVNGTAVLAETTECFGAEHLLVSHSRNRAVGERFLSFIEGYKTYLRQFPGTNFNDNPSPGNKEGGLTTILEKSLGAAAKAGATAMMDAVDYAERITSPGFVFMNTPGYDPVSLTGLAAGGCNLICFTTGRGSAIGFPTIPVVKIASNTAMYRRMTDNMDVNAGRIADGDATVPQVGQEIFEMLLRVASGERTAAERNGHHEFVPWRIGPVM